jgi:hypothetical protein
VLILVEVREDEARAELVVRTALDHVLEDEADREVVVDRVRVLDVEAAGEEDTDLLGEHPVPHPADHERRVIDRDARAGPRAVRAVVTVDVEEELDVHVPAADLGLPRELDVELAVIEPRAGRVEPAPAQGELLLVAELEPHVPAELRRARRRRDPLDRRRVENELWMNVLLLSRQLVG